MSCFGTRGAAHAAAARVGCRSARSSSSLLGRHDTRARRFLNLRRAADEMIEMSVAEDDVSDAPRIDADFPDVADDVVDIRLLGRVEQDVALGRRQQPDGDVARPDVIEVVEAP